MSNPSRLQAPQQDIPAGADMQQYLTFVVATEIFAFNIQNIKEIIEYGNVTQVPMMPRYVRGVINLRGNVVPVIDLAARFNHDLSSISKRSCIIIIELQGEQGVQDVGVVVDSVCEVLEIAGTEIEPAPSFGVSIRAEFIQGMGKVNGRFVIILDMNRVLALDDFARLDAMTQELEEKNPHLQLN